MAHLFRDVGVSSLYRDRKYRGDWHRAIEESCTVYVGNLSFYTTEEQLHDIFARAGKVERIVMGLDRVQRTPCGFCFVEYGTRAHTRVAVQCLNGAKLDERVIRVDWDGGFEEGRQYGRGRSGGQVRDEWRPDYDPARGGWGRQVVSNIEDGAAPVRARDESGPAGGTPAQPAKRQRAADSGGDGDVPPANNPRFRERAEQDEEEDN